MPNNTRPNPNRRNHPAHQAIDTDTQALERTDWTDLANRLKAAIDIELAHPSMPDGYPTHTPGAGPPTGPTNRDPDGVTLTAVEAVADYRTRQKDEYRKLIKDAIAYHQEIHRVLRGCNNKLEQINKLRGQPADPPKECQVMARIGIGEAVAHTVTINGKDWELGGWAYRFSRRNGRLPTIDECKRRGADGDRVIVKA